MRKCMGQNSPANSASIATLIRLKFLADIADTADVLCKQSSLSATPSRR